MPRAARHFRQRVDALDKYNDGELIERFRLDRNGILYICAIVRNDVEPRTMRNHSISCMQKVLITLRYLASGHFQIAEGDLNGISQPTVSRVIREVINSLTRRAVVQEHIRLPVLQPEVRENQQAFHAIAGFPNIVGLVDGTHIQVTAPSANEADYVNRMQYHSINTQIICSADDTISNVSAMWPGSTHDSRILMNSGVRPVFEGGRMPAGHCYLLGDSGYACKNWCLTPYLHPATNKQRRYNSAHKVTRSKVERVIGQLKRRWSVLHGEIRMKTDIVPRIITACVILHNICKRRNVPLPNAVNNVNIHIQQHLQFVGQQQGLPYRDHIAESYF